jgi:hypothetical protein
MYQLAGLCTKSVADLKNLKSEKRMDGFLIISRQLLLVTRRKNAPDSLSRGAQGEQPSLSSAVHASA